MIDKLRDEFADKRVESTNIQNTLDSIDIQIKKINTQIDALTSKVDEVQFQNQDVMISKDTIDREIAMLWEATIKYGEALKLKNDYDDELQGSIERLIALQNDEVFIVNEIISPKGKLNQILQEKLMNLIPEAKIVIIEENDLTGELKSVFRLYVGDIEYRNLSRSQKVGINIVLSKKLIEIAKVDYPLLIDDAEIFSTANINKLKSELQNSGVEYIITKVCNCSLSITTTS